MIAFFLLQKTLHLPVIKRPVNIDYLGATLIVAGISILLVWVSLAGNQLRLGAPPPRPRSWSSAACCCSPPPCTSRRKVAIDPIIPLRLFKDRTISLATFASVMIGVAMFGSTVYLSQYFQIARGHDARPRPA